MPHHGWLAGLLAPSPDPSDGCQDAAAVASSGLHRAGQNGPLKMLRSCRLQTVSAMSATWRSYSTAYRDFRWQPGVTPLSTPASVITLITAYLVLIAMGRQVFSRPAGVPAMISATHNLILCLGSLAMLLGTAWECLQVSRGPQYSILSG